MLGTTIVRKFYIPCSHNELNLLISRGKMVHVRSGWIIFIFRLFKSILLFVNWISLHFLHLLYYYRVLTCYVYYYCIWLRFKITHFLFFHSISSIFSQGISHGMWLLPWEFLLFFSVLHFAFMHLVSGYYYYVYVVIGVRCPRGLQKFSF